MPDGGQQAMQLRVLESVCGHWEQSDETGVHQQALRHLPAGTHAHHVVQEDLGEGPAGEGSSLWPQCIAVAVLQPLHVRRAEA